MKKYALPIILALALIVTGIWGYYQYNEKNDYHTYLDIQFQRQFYDLIGHVENAQVDLAKAMVSGGSKDIIKYLNDTIFQSYRAQDKLTQLPFDHGGIRRTESFLNQLGDYCTAMVNKSLEGVVLEESEIKTLGELQNYANILSQQLIELQGQIVKGGVNFGDLRREGNRSLSELNNRMKEFNLINFEEKVQDYPELIYDGPFSEHLQGVKPKLKGEKIKENEALDIIRKHFNKDEIGDIRLVGKTENTPIPGYHVQGYGKEDGDISFVITETGGKILWYLNPRPIGESKLDLDNAIKKADEFLKKEGYKDMVSTYTTSYEGQAVINFAYEDGDVIVYPDLIKVKVALDNGEIIGLETQGYLTNHQERNIGEPGVSVQEARQRLSSGVEIEEIRLAIIPTPGKKEVLCYEFKVSHGKDRYLIYIDANDGQQRQMLLLIDNKDGTLTI